MKDIKLILLLALLTGGIVWSCEELPEDEQVIERFDVTGLDTVETETGMDYIVVEEGDGAIPEQGDTVSVHYTLYLQSGEVQRSTHSLGSPYTFVYGEADFIEGFQQGIDSMQVGDKFRLLIPYYLAYGESGSSSIPPYADLIYDIEMLDVIRGPEEK